MKCFFILLLISVNAYSAEVVSLKGKVFLEGKPLQQKESFSDIGKLTTQENSYIKISHLGQTIALGSNSELWLKSKGEEAPSLIKGSLRWISGKFKSDRPVIKTANASFGVRGTDFLITYNGLLGESEIVCFSGEVEFKAGNLSKSIKKNQWGGVGGRFGNEIGKILDLPENVMKSFDESVMK